MSIHSKAYLDHLKAALHAREKAPEDSVPAESDFVQSLIKRGEAVRLKPGEELPPSATHEIIVEEGETKVVRRRFATR